VTNRAGIADFSTSDTSGAERPRRDEKKNSNPRTKYCATRIDMRVEKQATLKFS